MKKTLAVAVILSTLVAGCAVRAIDNIADEYAQYEPGTDSYCEMVLEPLIESGDADTLEALGEDALADQVREGR